MDAAVNVPIPAVVAASTMTTIEPDAKAVWFVTEDAESHAQETARDATSRPRVNVLRLAPPPPPESETPAHRVLRLGAGQDSPIHSQDPADWEDLLMPSGEVWQVSRGLQAMGERAFSAFHVRKTFHRVK